MIQIQSGGGEPKTEEIADRRDAIAKAMNVARAGDTVLITGMGHEQFRIVMGERLPWNDGDVVRELAFVGKQDSSITQQDEKSVPKEEAPDGPGA